MSDVTSSAAQWLRACSLIVADQQGNGIELAGPLSPVVLRIRFHVTYYMESTPAILHARVYNLSKATIQQIVSYTAKGPATIDGLAFVTSAQVILMAGYINNLGKLFKGQIYQLKIGYENSTDSYLDIFAADGNYAHTYSVANRTFAAGYTAVDSWNYLNSAFEPWGVTSGAPPSGLPSDPAPRGKVVFGQARDRFDELGDTYNFNWGVLDGQVQSLPKYTVRPGQAVRINHSTGMIGFPEQTAQGVTVTCLLNPVLRWGTHIVLDNEEVSRFLVTNTLSGTDTASLVSTTSGQANQFVLTGNPLSPTYVPPINADGNYTVLCCEHVGDTRGNEWYSKLTCLSIDPTAPLPTAGKTIPDTFAK